MRFPTSLALLTLLLPATALASPPPWSHAGGRAEEVDADSEESMGEFVRRMKAEGLRGRDLAEAIRAENLRRGHGPPEGKGWRAERPEKRERRTR